MISTAERVVGRPSRWPKTIDEERQMQVEFCQRYAWQVEELIHSRLPNNQLTDNQFCQLVMIYYGIYFYDHICGGRILSGETTNNKNAVEYRQKHGLPRLPSSPKSIRDNIALWPVNLHNGGGTPCSDARNSMIAIPTSSLQDIDTNEIHLYGYIDPKRSNPTIYSGEYQSLPALEHGIRYGIEEAQHSHFWYLERTHFNNSGESVDNINGPLRGYLQKKKVKEENSPDNMILYYSGIGSEFAAHMIIAGYYRRYFPYFWEKGQREYHEAVMAYRRQLVATRKPLS